MSLSLEEVEHIAHLARLKLNEEEKKRYQEQLSAILDYFTRLQDLDTAGIPGADSRPPAARERLRADKARSGLTTETLLGIAPEVEGAQYRVPAIFDQDSEEGTPA